MRLLRGCVVGAVVVSIGMGTPALAAAAITVTTTADELAGDGDCSFREAIRAANLDQAVDACSAGSGADTINLPAGTFSLTITGTGEDAALTGDLDISGDTTIRGGGPEATIIDGSGLDRVFDIAGNGDVLIEGLTVQGGEVASNLGAGVWNRAGTLTLRQVVVGDNVVRCGFCPGPAGGAGIANSGTLALERSAVVGNYSEISDGGGVWNSGVLTVSDTSVSRNTSITAGGGIWSSGQLTIMRSTLSGNRFSGAELPLTLGGGLFNAGAAVVVNSTFSGNSGSVGGHFASVRGGAIASVGTLSLRSVTITENVLNAGGFCSLCGSAVAAGVYTTGETDIANTILSGNTVVFVNPFEPSPRVVTPSDCLGTLVSRGYNLIGSGCTITGDTTGNLAADDPELGPLQDNGGDTFTHLPLPTSPVVDAGNPAFPGTRETACPATDQRGVARPQDGNADGIPRCDIGAVEVAGTTPTIEEQLAALAAAVVGVGPGDSLRAKVSDAQAALAANDVGATCSTLADFANEVQAQAEKKIPQGLAQDLLGIATAITSALGC